MFVPPMHAARAKDASSAGGTRALRPPGDRRWRPGGAASNRAMLQLLLQPPRHLEQEAEPVPSPVSAGELEISDPGDTLEQEADHVAELVMQRPEAGESKGRRSPFQSPQTGHAEVDGEPALMRKAVDGGTCESAVGIDLEQEEEEEGEEEPRVMAKRDSQGSGPSTLTLATSPTLDRGGGTALDPAARAFLEPRFGYDFGTVGVHTDHNAIGMAQAINAAAFTVGRDIFFNEGRYSPTTDSGRKLLAHELTHVIQQSPARSAAAALAPEAISRRPVGRLLLQRYALKGFPPAEEAAMRAAIPIAISKVRSCSSLSWWGRRMTRLAIDDMRYDYVPTLGLCGWTFPGSWYIEIGKEAFSPQVCCDLASTIAHEASHTQLYTEGRARKLECNCFKCSC